MADNAVGKRLLESVLVLARQNSSIDVFKDLLQHNADKQIAIIRSETRHTVARLVYGERSLIVKQHPSTGSDTASGHVVSSESSTVEYHRLTQLHQSCPGLAPTPYFNCSSQDLLIMEDSRDMVVLHCELMEGRVNKVALHKLAQNLGTAHSATYHNSAQQANFSTVPTAVVDSLLVQPYAPETVAGLTCPELKKAATAILVNQNVLTAVTSLRQLLQDKKECVLHGSLSPRHVMVKDGNVKLTGNEQAFIGPCGFDLGTLLAHYIIQYHNHMLTEEDNDRHRQVAYKMVDTCNSTVESYLEYMTSDVGDRQQFISSLLSDVAGFCGAEIIRRALTSQPNDIPSSKWTECLGSGVRLLHAQHRIHDISQLTNIALMLTH